MTGVCIPKAKKSIVTYSEWKAFLISEVEVFFLNKIITNINQVKIFESGSLKVFIETTIIEHQILKIR